MPKYKKAVAYDLETTGFSPNKNSILEIAAVTLYPDGTEENWSTLVYPEELIPEHITKLTGISKQTIELGPTAELKVAMRGFLDLVIEPDTLLIAHNGTAFDNLFLAEAGLPLPAKRCWDTLLQTRADLKKERGSSWYKTQEEAKTYRTKQKTNLLEAAKFYKIRVNPDDMHRALADARICLDIFKKQITRNRWTIWNNKQQ